MDLSLCVGVGRVRMSIRALGFDDGEGGWSEEGEEEGWGGWTEFRHSKNTLKQTPHAAHGFV